MTKKRKFFTILLSVLITATLGFIWGNSMKSIPQSSDQSEMAYSWVKAILDFIFGKDVITHTIFRKLVHFGEFFILGTEINLLFIAIKKYQIKRVYIPLLLGLAVAIVDEIIQIFFKRGASVIDVLIDFSGVFAISLIILIIYLIVKKRQGRKI